MVIKTEVKVLQPPSQLLVEAEKPVLREIKTTRDIVANLEAFELAYKLAQAQIKNLRDWFEKQEKEN